jgi:hypothetical protein
MITFKKLYTWAKSKLQITVKDPTVCPTCLRVFPIPDWNIPHDRRLLNPEWVEWYMQVHRVSFEKAWEQGAINVIVNEFPMKTRHHASTYKVIGDPLRVAVKYNDL